MYQYKNIDDKYTKEDDEGNEDEKGNEGNDRQFVAA